jgi:hypothetical protein
LGSDNSGIDLAATWGDQVQAALSGVVSGFSHQDAYEIWCVAMDSDLTLESLQGLAASACQALADVANEVLESDKINPIHMQAAVEGAIANWL